MDIKAIKSIPALILIFFACNAFSSANPVILKCQRISEDPDEAMIEISLTNKAIIFDSTEERALWDTFNKFLRAKNLETSPFRPIEYKVTKVVGSDIYGTQTGIFPMHGTIRINRSTLFVSVSIYRKEVPGGVIESSYKCEKADRGF